MEEVGDLWREEWEVREKVEKMRDAVEDWTLPPHPSKLAQAHHQSNDNIAGATSSVVPASAMKGVIVTGEVLATHVSPPRLHSVRSFLHGKD